MEKCPELIKAYETGLSTVKLSSLFGIPKTTVYRWLKKAGVIRSISEANTGKRNGMWKADSVGYTALHDWVKNRLEKPQVCDQCNERKSLDLANISQNYLRDLSDWEWLCRRCHMIKDGRMSNLKQYHA